MKAEIEHCFLHQLNAVVNVLDHLPDEQFTTASQYLSSSTIGQHCRHAVELMQCLQQGYEAGFVNYDARNRNELIQQDRHTCIAAFKDCEHMLHWADKSLQLKVIAHLGADAVVVQTTFLRELAYNLEHLIHHMALIRVGLIELGFENIPADFGYAYSTIQHQQQCVQ